MRLDYTSNDSGVPYGKTGASSYSEYLRRVSEDLGDVQDWGLPTTMNDHEHRHHNEEVGVDCARWTKLNTGKRAGDCILEAKDISSTSWAKVRFVDHNWSELWDDLFSHYERKAVSHAMTDCLRHNGCRDGEHLRCDSEGYRRGA